MWPFRKKIPKKIPIGQNIEHWTLKSPPLSEDDFIAKINSNKILSPRTIETYRYTYRLILKRGMAVIENSPT